MMPSDVLQELVQGLMVFARYVLRFGVALLAFGVIAHLIGWGVWRLAYYRRRVRGQPMSQKRHITMRYLIRSLTSALVLLFMVIFTLGQFVDAATLATTLGLFSAGLGFAARPFISDVMTGLRLLVRDEFAIGEKVEIGDRNVVGVVERMSLTATEVRGEAGELWIVPNGDVRTIRNFSRASFSPASIRVVIPTGRLVEVLALLQDVIDSPGPDVIEPPQVISEEGRLDETTVLLLKVKARYGEAPHVRRQLMERVYLLLSEHQIISGTQPVEAHAEQPRQAEGRRNE